VKVGHSLGKWVLSLLGQFGLQQFAFISLIHLESRSLVVIVAHTCGQFVLLLLEPLQLYELESKTTI